LSFLRIILLAFLITLVDPLYKRYVVFLSTDWLFENFKLSFTVLLHFRCKKNFRFWGRSPNFPTNKHV